MASTTTRIKPLRIKNDTADYFEKKPLNRMVESLEELLRSEKVRFDGENLIVKGSDSNIDLSDIEEMANLMRVPTEKILSDIKEMIEEGTLYYENGKMILPRYAELESVCERKGVNIDNLLTKVIRDIENGK